MESGGQNVTGIKALSDFTLNVTATCTIIISVVGVVGNSLTVLALLKCPKIRNVAAAFIVSLCIADFFFCLVVIPFSSYRFFWRESYHGSFLCQVVPFLQYSNVGVSLTSIAMITINRYIMIAHYQLYSTIYKPHWIGCMIAFCYALSFGMQVPTLAGQWGYFGEDKRLLTCSILPDKDGRSSKRALFFIGFVIPCTIIVLCYAKIFWVVRSSEKRLQRHNSKVQTSKKELKAKRNDMRITKMVLVIFLSFITCYFPITIVKLLDPSVSYPLFHVLSYIFLYLSACINPIIYVIMNKQYRVAYKTVLMCEKSKIFNSIRRTVTQSRDVKRSPDRDCDQVDNKTVFSTVPCNIPMDNLDLSDAVFKEDNEHEKDPEKQIELENNQRIS
uniref:G-protein coupled receptor moody n=1 Tax=Cacopsylla melanoneura TaxID=428564 RepID=A0A8D8YMS8_9HEMI